mgnify:CR=1 FL=1
MPQGRFTPTPVGISLRATSTSGRAPVHPHACGDIMFGAASAETGTGSPPRLWGYLQRDEQHARAGRFTPTPVGISEGVNCISERMTVHPHACGDIIRPAVSGCSASGSPPRLWGYLPVRIAARDAQRFTPTPVGISARPGPPAAGRTVHPHACGDIAHVSSFYAPRGGSPPRLWGYLPRKASAARWQRFTPTPVGISTWPCRSGTPTTVHPHACGDIEAVIVVHVEMHGSPPRLWGYPTRIR